MRCSLLALSSYLDAELEVAQTGELEAHLLACDRCRTAIEHLREESERIGALARVHIPDGAVHELFSQIGLIEEGDELPDALPHHDRPSTVEAPPWFGAERGRALPWAPRGGYESNPSHSRELIGERTPSVAVAEPPELFLWEEPMDQIPTSTVPKPVPTPPPVPVHIPTPVVEAPRAHEALVAEPQPPEIGVTGPEPPAVGGAAPQPLTAGAPNAFQRMRDAVAVRFALWRGAGSHLESNVEIVSGAGAPSWNQRAHPKAWTDSPPVVVAPEPPVVGQPLPPPVVSPMPEPEVVTTTVEWQAPVEKTAAPERSTEEPAASTPPMHDAAATEAAPVEPVATEPTASEPLNTEPSAAELAPPELADILGEVASLAAPLGRSTTPAPAPVKPHRSGRMGPMVAPLAVPEQLPELVDEPMDDIPGEHLAAVDAIVSPDEFREYTQPSVPTAPSGPGRHVRRLKSQTSDRRSWNPAQPRTGRHVLPIGGPAVAAADRDRRLWIFAAATVVVLVFGLLIGRSVMQTSPLVAPHVTKPRPTAVASAAPTFAPLPVATPATAVPTVPAAPTPAQLTASHTIGTGSSGFSVADVRIGEHPNDFRLVFDLAFPDTVTGAPTTVIGYDGPTTLYLEFTGVTGTAPIETMPAGQVVVSVTPLPMVRNTNRLIFKITLRKNAPFDAYYLSGARLVIDIT